MFSIWEDLSFFFFLLFSSNFLCQYRILHSAKQTNTKKEKAKTKEEAKKGSRSNTCAENCMVVYPGSGILQQSSGLYRQHIRNIRNNPLNSAEISLNSSTLPFLLFCFFTFFFFFRSFLPLFCQKKKTIYKELINRAKWNYHSIYSNTYLERKKIKSELSIDTINLYSL